MNAVDGAQDGPPTSKGRCIRPPLEIAHPAFIRWMRPIALEARGDPHVFHQLGDAHEIKSSAQLVLERGALRRRFADRRGYLGEKLRAKRERRSFADGAVQ